MTMEFQRDQFDNAATLPMLVIVNRCKRHLLAGAGSYRAASTGIIARCRAALSAARALVVAFVRGEATAQTCNRAAGGWTASLNAHFPWGGQCG